MFSEFLKKEMVSRNLTQKEIAIGIGTSPQSLHNAIVRDNFTEKMILKICDYLGYDLNYNLILDKKINL